MSKEDVEVARRFQDLLTWSPPDGDPGDGNDFESALRLIAADCVFRVPPSMPHAGEWIGPDGFVRMCERFDAAWKTVAGPDLIHRDAGDIVLVHATFELESRHNGTRVPVEMTEMIKVKHGKLVELVPCYFDTVPLAAAAGRLT